ncbi:MAG: hypothetical protein ACI9ON_002394 [Limisphaerales bacterium]|jgi:phage-related protein
MGERLNSWLQLGTSIGVLIGLVLVILQLQQGTKITTAQLGSESFESTIRANDLIVGEGLAVAWSRAMANADDLTDAELGVIDAFLRREWLNNTRTIRNIEFGFAAADWDDSVSVRKWVFGYLGNETAIRWWRQEQSRGVMRMSADFAAKVDALLLEQGSQHHLHHENRLANLRSGVLYP